MHGIKTDKMVQVSTASSLKHHDSEDTLDRKHAKHKQKSGKTVLRGLTELMAACFVCLFQGSALLIHSALVSLTSSLLSSQACLLHPDRPPAGGWGGVHLAICIQHLQHMHQVHSEIWSGQLAKIYVCLDCSSCGSASGLYCFVHL